MAQIETSLSQTTVFIKRKKKTRFNCLLALKIDEGKETLRIRPRQRKSQIIPEALKNYTEMSVNIPEWLFPGRMKTEEKD